MNVVVDDGTRPWWPTCTEDRDGMPCRGKQIEWLEHCLAHLEPKQLAQTLQRFGPGSNLDIPGTHINPELLEKILNAVASETESATLGDVNLAYAHFTGPVWLNARFMGQFNAEHTHF